jgi:phospholipid/cholesterol/gamma-HCH transport system substrate-binding protein
VKRAIKAHRGDFAAIVALLVLSLLVAGYILENERFQIPFVNSTPFTIYADFPSAKAVTPGQGQSVRISGVQIGLISGIQLKQGYARVGMAIQPKYRHVIHTDWTALLRPRTGLDDMFVELSPPIGGGSAPVVRPGYTFPLERTLPVVDLDQIERELDGDTRNYLSMLINGAGQGLAHNGGAELAQVLDRFEPTHQDLARLNGAVAVRGRQLQQLVDSLARLNTALADKQTQLASLVQASDRVFTAFSSQDANVRRAIALLPGTLRQTTQTLADVQAFSRQLGPAATNLLPAATALPAANAALRRLAVPSAPILRNQIRPFVLAARPVVRNLRPAAVRLARAAPSLRGTFKVLNDLGNMLGYNPGNQIHGYLWWLAWADHDARTLFSNQDANGDLRNLFLQLSCASLAQIVNASPAAEVLLNLTPILTSTGACPTQAAADAADYRAYRHGKLSGLVAHTAATLGAKVPFLPKLPTK